MGDSLPYCSQIHLAVQARCREEMPMSPSRLLTTPSSRGRATRPPTRTAPQAASPRNAIPAARRPREGQLGNAEGALRNALSVLRIDTPSPPHVTAQARRASTTHPAGAAHPSPPAGHGKTAARRAAPTPAAPFGPVFVDVATQSGSQPATPAFQPTTRSHPFRRNPRRNPPRNAISAYPNALFDPPSESSTWR